MDVHSRGLHNSVTQVIDLVLEVLDERFRYLGFDTEEGVTTQLLRETFQTIDLLPRIEARFGNEVCTCLRLYMESRHHAVMCLHPTLQFFSRKQTKVDLVHGRIAKFFSKLANEAASTALHAEVLKHATTLKSKREILSFFKDDEFAKLDNARIRWADAELGNCIGSFLKKQFKELQNDLTSKGGKGRHLGLLESLLRAFFTHVVQTAKASYACSIPSVHHPLLH